MTEGEHDVGFAFDGDGDRVLAVDRAGAVVDGDELIALAALHLRAADRLPGHGVAVTVMTNYGFHTAMRAAGVEVATTPVGDRYVLEALRERGWALGGEQSGHIIDMGFVPSGDGIAAALLDARGARRRRPRRAPRDGEAAAEARQRPHGRPRGARRRHGGRARGDRARGGRPRGPRPRARTPERHRAARAGDGRGADRRGGGRRVRAAGRGGGERRPSRLEAARTTAWRSRAAARRARAGARC